MSREGLRLTAPGTGTRSRLQLTRPGAIGVSVGRTIRLRSPRALAANHVRVRLTGREPRYRNPAESLMLQHFGAGLLCSVSGVGRRR